jgi:hypothetical protein
MRLTYILKCGECPMYSPGLPRDESSRLTGPPTPQACNHPDSTNITLGGPEAMPHKCPMLRVPISYRAAIRSKSS